MDEHDLSRRLRDAAASPSRDLDQAAIDRGVARRRRRRHAGLGAAAAALVLLGGFAAFSMLTDDEAADLQFVDTPTTSTTEPPDDDGEVDVGWSSLESIPPQATAGFAVQQDDAMVLVELDGSEGWRGRLRFADLSELAGLESDVLTLRLPITQDGDLHWWDPSGATLAWHPSAGLPLAYGGLVGGADGFLRGAEVEVAEAARWWVSSDMRVLTWTECESGCPYRTYDSLTGEVGELLPGCWVAARAIGDELGTLICADGTQVVPPPHDHAVDVAARFGQPARAIAAWPNGVVWLDLETCHAHDAVRIVDGVVRSILSENLVSAPSAIPLGVAPDGRMVVHLNAAACDAADPDMGVYLVDLETRERELVWAGAVLPGDVRAWSPPAPRPMVVPEGTTEVELVDLDGRFLVFGSEGIAWLDSGRLEPIWDEPVEAAYPDGAGGVVFQELGDAPSDMDGETGSIRWLRSGSSTAEDLIDAGGRAELRQVLPLDGEPTVLFTRRSGDERSDSVSERLLARGLLTGTERDVGRTGGYESSLDAVTLTNVGLFTSSCHLQCTVRRFIDDAWDDEVVVRMPSWISGLDGTGALLVFVELEWHPAGVTSFRNPALVLMGLNGDEHRRAQLPYDPEGSLWSWVDLAPGARSALVVTPRSDPGEAPRFDVVLVTGLDTAEPRVQVVRTDHALRFG